ncbi:MAG TPA: alkaline phosphatase family protein [Rhizomicrobium sp.]|nr:alkaline phosphatase family protein [Rhizomicrobium sp.]
MQPKRSSSKAFLRSGVAGLAALPMISTAALADAMFHGENPINTVVAPPAHVAVAKVKTPHGKNDNNTMTPIKHVIIIVGENRSFDHLFATYVSPSGDSVLNLLSEGIVNADGTPGPNFSRAKQRQASDTTTYSISPTITKPYRKLPPPNLNFTPEYQSYAGAPWVNTQVAGEYDYGLLPEDLPAATEGASGLPYQTIDTRIANVYDLPGGPFQLSPGVGSGDYANSPVHRFYQMFQQLDCSASYATKTNPSGCQANLFPWVEVTIGAGSNGNAPPPNFNDETTHEGATSMGFYNVQQGDAPYFKSLADQYTLLDNYHQPAKGGTGLDSLYLGYADALWYSDGKGHPATPPSDQIENPDPYPGSNNWYTQDGYSGGTYSECSDSNQKGVASVDAYLSSLSVNPNCDAGHYYLLNNYNPGYVGDGQKAEKIVGPYTIPPSSVPSIADVLNAYDISWAYYGEAWTAYVQSPNYYAEGSEYCNICNPFLYETQIMRGVNQQGVPYRIANLHDTTDLYDAISTGELPAVSYVKPSGVNDGHPESSQIAELEGFIRKIVTEVQKNRKLANSTAILITVDEGGGYYDSGYVQQLDFFGDGTRIPLLIVSPWTKGGHTSHVYSDHASVPKFIEANWGLPAISGRSRDNMPNPITDTKDPYVPTNGPAISDLMAAFNFSR